MSQENIDMVRRWVAVDCERPDDRAAWKSTLRWHGFTTFAGAVGWAGMPASASSPRSPMPLEAAGLSE
jgi:hypothetical protein